MPLLKKQVEQHPYPLVFAMILLYLDELIQRKVAGAEKERLTEADLDFHRGEYVRLQEKLQLAHEASGLPEAPRGSAALRDLLVRIRIVPTNQA
jgi:hypothetical protein